MNASFTRFRREVIRRLTDVKINQCYLDVFKYLIDNKIDYNVNKIGVFFNITVLSDDALLYIDKILKQYEMTNACW